MVIIDKLLLYQDILCGIRCHVEKFSSKTQTIIDKIISFHNAKNLKIFDKWLNLYLKKNGAEWICVGIAKLLCKSFVSLGTLDRGYIFSGANINKSPHINYIKHLLKSYWGWFSEITFKGNDQNVQKNFESIILTSNFLYFSYKDPDIRKKFVATFDSSLVCAF